MGRAYAGVLGYLAAALTLARGAIVGGDLDGALLTAIAALGVFAVIGFVIGAIAERTIDQAICQRLEAQLQDRPSTEAT